MTNLNRFIDAQAHFYRSARRELKNGKKVTHWMWFVFPQIEGLGKSDMALKYAIADLTEAKAYLAHPILGNRLRECVEILLTHENLGARDIMGTPDDLKLRSSLTLFELASENVSDRRLFAEGSENFFDGNRDEFTIKALSEEN